MVERQLPKLHTRVRFPSPAPVFALKTRISEITVADRRHEHAEQSTRARDHRNCGQALALPCRTEREKQNAAVILSSAHHLDGHGGGRAGRNVRSGQSWRTHNAAITRPYQPSTQTRTTRARARL